jgi:hypothetical protein
MLHAQFAVKIVKHNPMDIPMSCITSRTVNCQPECSKALTVLIFSQVSDKDRQPGQQLSFHDS